VRETPRSSCVPTHCLPGRTSVASRPAVRPRVRLGPAGMAATTTAVRHD
jgi:hypothetical protein